ncbi:MAG: hypothetical protein HGB06_08425 [Chlorobaculum sp.]|nr:hypothetical protein [Chlorobaculum sp.]
MVGLNGSKALKLTTHDVIGADTGKRVMENRTLRKILGIERKADGAALLDTGRTRVNGVVDTTFRATEGHIVLLGKNRIAVECSLQITVVCKVSFSIEGNKTAFTITVRHVMLGGIDDIGAESVNQVAVRSEIAPCIECNGAAFCFAIGIVVARCAGRVGSESVYQIAIRSEVLPAFQ